MRKLLAAVAFCSIVLTNVFSQPLTGTYTLPGTVNSTQVNNLTQLAALINSGTVNGTAVFEFTQAYAGGETFPIVFSPFAGGGKVVIRPAASVVSMLTSAGSPPSTALIDLNGVNNLTFDGRPGGVIDTVMWQFQNTAVGGSYPVFRFINGAAYNSLKYLTIQASGGSSGSTILFSTSNTGTGNSYDTVQYCNIGNYAGYPYNPVLSNGTAGAAANANNNLINNNIYNFQHFNNSSPYYAGINITATGNGGNWYIIGNSIYSTINPLSLGSYPCRAIYFNAGANSTGNVVAGNYIGGQAPKCAGAPWQVAAYGANGYADFDGIYIAAGGITAVSGNTIQNITMASKYGSSTFRGINIVSGGATVTNNIVGSATAPHSILSGIYGTILGIQNQSSGTVVISANTVANLTANNSSFVSGTSTTTTGVTIGIYGYNSGLLGPCTINHNQVFNFSRIDNYNNNLYFPVSSGGGISGQTNIYQQNVIAGICVQTTGSASQAITANTIYNLYDSISGGTSRIYINGIVMNAAAGTHTVSSNFIYGLWTLDNFGASSYYAGLNGIYLPTSFSGTYLVYNNMVNLGYRPNGSSVQNALITGIWDNTNNNNANLKLRIYHNSVYVGGTNNNAFSNNLNSYAFRRMLSYSSTVYDSVVLKNNIFVNNRTTATGTAKNYGIYWNSLINVEGNYNDVYGTGTNYIFGNVGGTDYATQAAFNTANTAQEANTIFADPLYSSPTSGTFDLHIGAGSPCDQAGTITLTTVYDYDSIIRANATPVDMGATTTCSGGAAPTITLSSTQDSICPGAAMNFTAAGTNWGGNTTVTFYVNNVVKQSGGATTFTATNLLNGDSVKAIVTTAGGCNAGTTVTSNTIVVHVSTVVVPNILLTASTNAVCQGQGVSFTTAVNGGGNVPTYNFYLNGASVQNGANATYYANNLHITDSVYVVLTSNAVCANPVTVQSNVVKVTVNPIYITARNVSICPGSTYQFNSNTLNQAGTYYDTLSAVTGCDSVIQLNLTIRSVDSTITTATICNGGSYNFNGTNIFLAGTYRDTVTASTGCDSILVLHLNVTNAVVTALNNTICAGSSYTFNGQNITVAGTYYDTLTTAGGCDSIIELHLTVNSVITAAVTDSICNGGSYNFNGQNLTTAGVYNATYTAVGGCDSIVTLTLLVHAGPTPAITISGVDTLTTGNYSSYQWLKNGVPVNGATGITYIATADGNYAVIVTDAFGCSDTSAGINILHSGIATIQEMGINIYPNPTQGMVNIIFSGVNTGVAGVELMDIMGRIVLAEKIGIQPNGICQLNIQAVASGTYLLRVVINNVSTVSKIQVIK